MDRDDAKGVQGVQGVQGHQGVQGLQGSGERGAKGERGQTGKAGSRTKLPRRVFIAFIVLSISNAAAFAVALEDRTRNLERIVDGRRIGILDSCHHDELTTELMRTILNNSLRPRPDETPLQAARRREAARLYRRLFRPLGGLDSLTPEQQHARCLLRIERALNPPD